MNMLASLWWSKIHSITLVSGLAISHMRFERSSNSIPFGLLLHLLDGSGTNTETKTSMASIDSRLPRCTPSFPVGWHQSKHISSVILTKGFSIPPARVQDCIEFAKIQYTCFLEHGHESICLIFSRIDG